MDQKIQQQLTVIDSLLRSPDFNAVMAKVQDTAYYTGIGEPIPPFSDTTADSAITKNATEEKIAANLAGFYALECGVVLLCAETHEKPTAWLEKIIADKADPAAVLLLNRFANATWKAGQPFQGLNRIARPAFTGAGFLPPSEVLKDYHQVKSAAGRLLLSMRNVQNSSMNVQMEKIRNLLHSREYALEMAAVIEEGYHSLPKKNEQALIAHSDETATTYITVREQKIAINVAGFYALECCINYLVTTKHVLPSNILQSITDNSISKEDKNLFSRFANATWKAGQPFRGLDRIERETFTPFYFLNAADIEKDWVQIKSAAKKVFPAIAL